MGKRIEMGSDESYEVFVKNNEMKIWNFIIDTIQKLLDDDNLDNLTAFIIHGKKLDRDKEIIIRRSSVLNIIDNGIKKMELYEEYEMCIRLNKFKEKLSQSIK